MNVFKPLNEEFIPLYNSPEGRKKNFISLLAFHLTILNFTAENIYKETLDSVTQSFPQYVRELQGIADGSQVEFYKVRQSNFNTRFNGSRIATYANNESH